MSPKDRSPSFLSGLLLLATYLNFVPLNASAQEQLPQQASPPARERRVLTAPVDAATAAPAAKPGDAPETVEQLRARIQAVLRQPQLAPAQFAVKVASLETGRTLFEENAGKLLHPASNMKLYTVATALDRLSPDYRFTTSVYAPAKPDQVGTVAGDMIIYGRGDPTLAPRFYNGDYYKGINELADRIAAAGVRKVEGDLIADESYFTGPPLGTSWEWDDLQWYYGAEVSALSINDNVLDLSVRPGGRVGDPCIVTTALGVTPLVVTEYAKSSAPERSEYSALPYHNPGVTSGKQPVVMILNRAMTSPRGTRRELFVHRPLGQNVIIVGGSMPEADPGFTASIAVAQPAVIFSEMLRQALQQRGIVITGRTRIVSAEARRSSPLQTSTLVEIANRQSPPLSLIAGHILKPSQNLYTELLLRALGKSVEANDLKRTSAEAGLEAVRAFLRQAGVDTSVITLADGSGLSRSNFVTADATVQLLTYMYRHRYNKIFLDAQPIAGVDGTLRNRMKGTLAAGNVRAKTGTLNTVAALSGYVTSAAGERLVFSLMINNLTGSGDAPRNYLDQIAVLLAQFNGRSQPQGQVMSDQ